MRKNNFWKIVSYVSLMSGLLIILNLVIIYKVRWQTRDFNTYLYFYSCNDVVCTSTTKPKDIKYSKMVCEDNKCPYISSFLDNIVVLNDDEYSWLYDYKSGEVYHNEYVKYEPTNDGFFKITDNDLMQGIMNKEGKLLTQNKYNEIVDYSYGLIVYKNDNKMGIDYVSGESVITAKYDDVILVNNMMYAVLNNNKYQVYNVVNNSPVNDYKYDYIWSNDNVIIAIKDNQLDVLNNQLESNLVMKVKTYLGYTTNAERKSLKIYEEDDNIYFNVNINNVEYTQYKYNTNTKQIFVNN